MARSKASALLAGAPTHLVNSSDIQSKMESVFVDDDEPAPVIVPTISIVLTKPVTAVVLLFIKKKIIFSLKLFSA